MSGGGGGGTSTITEIALPTYADDKAMIYIARAKHMTEDDGALQYDYTGNTFAAWNQDEQDGIDALVDRATNGATVITKGKALVDCIVGGRRLNTNTKLDDLFDTEVLLAKKEFTEDTLPLIHSESNNLGMYGSSGHAIEQAKAAERVKHKLNKVSADIYYNDYEIERLRMINYYNNAILYGHEELRNAEALRQVGLYKREYYQAQHTDAFRLWMSEQDGDIKKIDVYANAVRCLRGAYISRTEPFYRPSTMTQIAGLAMAGGGLMASYYGMKKRDSQIELQAFNPQPERSTQHAFDKMYDLGGIEE